MSAPISWTNVDGLGHPDLGDEDLLEGLGGSWLDYTSFLFLRIVVVAAGIGIALGAIPSIIAIWGISP